VKRDSIWLSYFCSSSEICPKPARRTAPAVAFARDKSRTLRGRLDTPITQKLGKKTQRLQGILLLVFMKAKMQVPGLITRRNIFFAACIPLRKKFFARREGTSRKMNPLWTSHTSERKCGDEGGACSDRGGLPLVCYWGSRLQTCDTGFLALHQVFHGVADAAHARSLLCALSNRVGSVPSLL